MNTDEPTEVVQQAMAEQNSISYIEKVEDFRQMPIVGYPINWHAVTGRDHCLHHVWNMTTSSFTASCPTDWEPYINLCWPPTPSGFAAKVPCPDDGYLNPHEFVYRYCTLNGEWYVNKSFEESKPYSNYQDCLKQTTYDVDYYLKKNANAQTVMILKTLYDYRIAHSLLNCVSFSMLVVALVICVLHTRGNNHSGQKFKYFLFIIIIFSLISNQITSMSTKLFYDVSYIIKCRVSKTFISFSNIVVCECLFACIFLYMAYLMQYRLRTKVLNLTLVLIIAVAGFLVIVELLMEVYVYQDSHCGFGTSNSSYHWVISAPKFLTLACTFCLASVVLHSVFVLNPTHVVEDEQLKPLRLNTVCLLLMVVINSISEVLLVVLHHAAAMEFPEADIQVYTHSFAAVSTGRGIFFAILMCFLDSKTQARMPCRFCSIIHPTQPEFCKAQHVRPPEPVPRKAYGETSCSIPSTCFTQISQVEPLDELDADSVEAAGSGATVTSNSSAGDCCASVKQNYYFVLEHDGHFPTVSSVDNKPTLGRQRAKSARL